MPKRARDPVPWIVGLFAANFLLQRISVPSLSIPVIVPLALVWVLVALRAGVVSINTRRLVLWLLAASVSGLLVTAQLAMVRSPYVSANSWALWMVLWLPWSSTFGLVTWTPTDAACRGSAPSGSVSRR